MSTPLPIVEDLHALWCTDACSPHIPLVVACCSVLFVRQVKIVGDQTGAYAGNQFQKPVIGEVPGTPYSMQVRTKPTHRLSAVYWVSVRHFAADLLFVAARHSL